LKKKDFNFVGGRRPPTNYASLP